MFYEAFSLFVEGNKDITYTTIESEQKIEIVTVQSDIRRSLFDLFFLIFLNFCLLIIILAIALCLIFCLLFASMRSFECSSIRILHFLHRFLI